MNQNQTLVLQHDGFSYIKLESYALRVDPKTLIVNDGELEATPCPGAAYWVMVKGDVRSLRVPQPPQKVLAGYSLRSEYRETTTFPHELPPEAFKWALDDDELSPADSSAVYQVSFYEPSYNLVDTPPLEIDLVIVDRDCAPIDRPGDVMVEFPASLREYPETWHKHPVSISGEALFLRATALLREAVAARPADFAMTDYASIGTFTLFRIMHHKPAAYTYHVGKKTKRGSRTQSNVEVMKISSPKSSYHDGAVVPATLRGENWQALKAQIDSFLDMIRAYTEQGRVRLCPHCDGEGFLIDEVSA